MKSLIITLGVVTCITTPTWGQSKVQNFDFGWKFIEQDVKEAQLPSCNDGKWTRVNLPMTGISIIAPRLMHLLRMEVDTTQAVSAGIESR